MPKRHGNPPDPLFAGRQRKPIPHEFVLDAMAALSPRTNPMFGCLAVYVREKIVLILRDRPTSAADNGVWLATTPEHHESLRRDFPNMRSIGVLGKKVTGWQILPVDAPDFEESAQRACEFIAARDPRIGKAPGVKKRAKAAKATLAAAKKQKKNLKRSVTKPQPKAKPLHHGDTEPRRKTKR